MKENDLKCCVSGSFFKFKPEIDSTIDEFSALGVTVLAPDKGWLNIPQLTIRSGKDFFRPLSNEINMSVKEIEDEFLRNVAKSHFLYVANFENYIGPTVWMEIGFALGNNIPCYSKNLIDDFDGDVLYWRTINGMIQPATPLEVVSILTETGKKGTP